MLDKAGVSIDKAGVTSEKAGVMLAEFQKLAAGLNDPNQQLQQLLASFGKIAAGLERGEGSAGKLLKDTAMMDELQKVIAQSEARMEELKPVLANLRRTTERLPELTGALAKDLPVTLRESQEMLRELTRLIEGIQRHWLFRKYVDKDEPSPSAAPPSSAPPKTSRPARDSFKLK